MTALKMQFVSRREIAAFSKAQGIEAVSFFAAGKKDTSG
jgi:hypothetical protein